MEAYEGFEGLKGLAGGCLGVKDLEFREFRGLGLRVYGVSLRICRSGFRTNGVYSVYLGFRVAMGEATCRFEGTNGVARGV